MDRQQVITVLESLANGIDPGTGARIPLDAFHSGDAVRALFTASTLLKAPAARPRAASTALTAAGTAWTEEEDARLCKEFDEAMTIAQIALGHGRSSGAITARLVKLGRIDPSTVKSRDRGAKVA
jgi:hypothetical protein